MLPFPALDDDDFQSLCYSPSPKALALPSLSLQSSIPKETGIVARELNFDSFEFNNKNNTNRKEGPTDGGEQLLLRHSSG